MSGRPQAAGRSDAELRCPMCAGAARMAFVAQDRNREITDEHFSYARCALCASYFLVNLPPDLARYYPPAYYDVPEGDLRAQLEAAERFKVQLLRDRVTPGRLLEVGPGYGLFAAEAKRSGFDVTGIEMDERSCVYLEQRVGIRAIRSDRPEDVIGDLPPSRVVCLWQVIEHLPEPWRVLESAAQNLEPGGVLALSTPNPQSVQFRLAPSRWAHLDAPRHLQLIPSGTLISRAHALGLSPTLRLSDDPAGLMCNRMSWELAMLRRPARRGPNVFTSLAAKLVERAAGALEHRPTLGTTYTAFFVKAPTSVAARGR